MTIWGIGVDVVDLARFEASLERTPELRSRLFTDAEAALSLESMAGRFAAKEAFVKALKAPAGMSWQDIEVVTDPPARRPSPCTARPRRGPASSGITGTHLSISHDTSVATAFVVAEC